jgi:ergothioneine biosynthesis protein EgtB
MDHASLHQDFRRVRARSRELFGRLAPEAFDLRPIPLRLQFRFYEGHLANFNLRMMLHAKFVAIDPNPRYSIVFDRGIDPREAAGADANKIGAAYPPRGEVGEYLDQVDDTLERAFAAEAPLELLATCVEHEMMHQETLHYMMHQLGHELKSKPAELHAEIGGDAPAENWIEVPQGRAELGAKPGSAPFGWDNEFPGASADVPAYRLLANKVSNGQYLEFVDAGGYRDPRWWTEAGWAQVAREQLAFPRFWFRHGEGWRLRGLFEDYPLPASWPAWVSRIEAEAFCRFKGWRLPSEAQWHRALALSPEPDPARDNYGWTAWNPAPVNNGDDGRIAQLVGNGWEWTSTPFRGFPGFTPMAQYPNYSSDFFDDHHYVIKGASPLTDKMLTRPSFRNWFQDQYPYAYIGFRGVRDN